MASRDKILAAVKKNQAPAVELPEINVPSQPAQNNVDKFKTILTNIGGTVLDVGSYEELLSHVSKNFAGHRIVSTIPELAQKFGVINLNQNPHLLENVNLAILQAQLGVAENGSVWITDNQMGDRALPFITEHLALVISRQSIVATMHDAYEKIGTSNYNLGTFIAGPSKTADIEQSLVLGAHGAKSLIIFLME